MTHPEAVRIIRASNRPGWLTHLMVPDWDRWHEARKMLHDHRQSRLRLGDHKARGFAG